MKIKSISKEKVEVPGFEDVRNWYEKHLHPDANSYDDQTVYEKVYHNGAFAGVFQCTSRGAQKLFTEAKPNSIVDIAVLTSIYRPGPLAAKVDQIYLDAKNHGKKFDWGHPLFDKVLGPTYNCLSGDTKILTDDGEIRIDQIKVGQSLPTLNELTGELVNDTVIAIVENGVKELYEVETETGILKITGEHKVLTESRGWLEVKNLTLENKILTPKSSVTIKSIKKISAEKVYDIQTKQHNFIANGHIVHNCLIFQESVMALAEHIGGFPKEKCDDVRRAIMKRDLSKGDAAIKEAQKMEDDFVAGAISKGITEATARKAYQNILWFAGYGFNRAHAVAYAIDSYMCAWLLTHYEEEWLCTYLESMSDNSEDRARAFSEAKNLGYSIKSVDINHSGREWTSINGQKTLVQSFNTIKGVGEAAVNEIMLYRPYNSIEDLLWKQDGTWKHSKFNKKSFENLIKTFSFDSMNIVGEGKLFKNYKQMYHVIIEHYDQLKKKNGKDLLYKLIKETSDIEDWGFNEKIQMQLELIGDINVLNYINPETIQKLKDKGIESLSETDFEDSNKKITWFLVMSSNSAKTKNGKQYTQLMISGADGKQQKVFAWGIVDPNDVPAGRAYVAELEKTQFGLSLQGKKIKELL